MWESFLNGITGAGDKVAKPLTGAWDYLNTAKNQRIMNQINAIPEGEDVPDELLAELAEAEDAGDNKSIMDKVGAGLQAMGGMAPRTGQQQMSFGGGGRSGGGTNIQTRDEYADAMKMLIDKYGHLMFNKNF